MSDRCVSALEAAVPDGDGYRDASVILQCGRAAGHKGVHRFTEEVTWRG